MNLVSLEGAALPLLSARLQASARGGLAEVVLEQRFRNPYPTPLTVQYRFPLPADAAVSAYAFTIGARRIDGEIDRHSLARERFERALAEGKSAGLVEQDRTSLFVQEIGNVPPGAEVVASLTLDQRLRWLAEGVWEWRFPTAAAPRYGEGTIAVADGPLPVRLTLALAVGDELAGPLESPSHRLSAAGAQANFAADGGVALDRDVVVRWPVARASATTLETATGPGGAACGLLTLVPPKERPAPIPRDLIVLLDTSGSMADEPLRQARRVVAALIDTLGEGDRLELIAFSRAPQRWRQEPAPTTAAVKREALAWLGGLTAAGGTEMHQGIREALRPIRAGSQRQVVLVTDGLIGFEERVIGSIAGELPPSCRLHAVGVGSAVNRALTGPAARAGRGVEVIISLGEDAERAARRLVAATDAPLVVDLVLEGSALVEHAPRRLPDLYAGAPVLIAVALRSEGGALTARGRTAAGPWQETVQVAAIGQPGASGARPEGRRCVGKLLGREQVEDLEVRAAAGEPDLDGEIERLGLTFQIATRLTSWIAIDEEPAIAPGQPTRRVRVPQELPHGISVEALGLRTSGLQATMMLRPAMTSMAAPPATAIRAQRSGPPARPSAVVPPMGIFTLSDHERRFRGRVVAHEGSRLTLELTVTGPDLAWPVGHQVEVAAADRRRAWAAVLESTPAGLVRTGDVVRLVLDLATLPLEVIVSGGPERVIIVL